VQARPAAPEDADTVARIYSQGIEERIATFETRKLVASIYQDKPP